MAQKTRGARLLSPQEKALWRTVAKSAEPLRGRMLQEDPQSLERLAPAPAAHKQPLPVRAERFGPPADRAREKRVRRGRVEIDASIDLHGYAERAAHAALRAFVLRQRQAGARLVVAITGKGRGGGEGVLKRAMPMWLSAADLRSIVADYSLAHRRHGGAGAFYIFLKSRPKD